jgi:transposase
VLRVARRSAIKARGQAANQLHSLLVTAPDPLRHQLGGLPLARLVQVAAAVRPGPLTDPLAATKFTLRELARRYQLLTAELDRLDAELAVLTPKAAPRLLARRGVGAQVAGALLVVAGDNPGRLCSEAAFSMLCGSSPLEASSGKTVRHRLNRGGDREANNALWTIAMTRLSCDERTQRYLARRTAEGKSKREIIRCLIGRVSLTRSAWSGSCSSVGVRGMASLPSRQTASLSSATPGAPRPADRLQGHARSKGRTMRHRQHGPRHPASEHAIESRSRRCSWDGTGPAPHTT